MNQCILKKKRLRKGPGSVRGEGRMFNPQSPGVDVWIRPILLPQVNLDPVKHPLR